MTRRNVRKQGWVFPLFFPSTDDRLSLNFHRFVILYILVVIHEVWALDNTVYRKCPMALSSFLFHLSKSRYHRYCYFILINSCILLFILSGMPSGTPDNIMPLIVVHGFHRKCDNQVGRNSQMAAATKGKPLTRLSAIWNIALLINSRQWIKGTRCLETVELVFEKRLL